MNVMTATFAYIGQTEMLIIAGVALLLFGGAKLPQLAKGVGEAMREFKKSMNDEPASPSATKSVEEK